MVTKTSRTYKFTDLTISLIEQLAQLPDYRGNCTLLLEMLVLDKARAEGLVKNGNGKGVMVKKDKSVM